MKPSFALPQILSALLLCACVAPGVSYDSLQSSLSPVAENHGRVFFYRLEGDGERVTTAVRASGLPLGRSVAGEFFYADLTEGTHIITAAKNTDRSLSLRVADDATYFVRVDVVLRAMRVDWDLVLVPEERALAELAQTTYSGN